MADRGGDAGTVVAPALVKAAFAISALGFAVDFLFRTILIFLGGGVAATSLFTFASASIPSPWLLATLTAAFSAAFLPPPSCSEALASSFTSFEVAGLAPGVTTVLAPALALAFVLDALSLLVALVVPLAGSSAIVASAAFAAFILAIKSNSPASAAASSLFDDLQGGSAAPSPAIAAVVALILAKGVLARVLPLTRAFLVAPLLVLPLRASAISSLLLLLPAGCA